MLQVYVYKRIHSVYRVWYYLGFQTSTWGLGIYPLRIRGDYCILRKKNR